MRETTALAKAKPEAGRPREKEKPGERALHGGCVSGQDAASRCYTEPLEKQSTANGRHNR